MCLTEVLHTLSQTRHYAWGCLQDLLSSCWDRASHIWTLRITNLDFNLVSCSLCNSDSLHDFVALLLVCICSGRQIYSKICKFSTIAVFNVSSHCLTAERSNPTWDPGWCIYIFPVQQGQKTHSFRFSMPQGIMPAKNRAKNMKSDLKTRKHWSTVTCQSRTVVSIEAVSRNPLDDQLTSRTSRVWPL